jgi:RES domain-containing protein
MSGIKRLLEEIEEQGWEAPDKYVCAKCVHDNFLKSVIKHNVATKTCDYCKSTTKKDSAAAMEHLFPHIAQAVNLSYSDLSSAGVPYDGEWLVDGLSTEEMLQDLSDAFDGELLEEIAFSFSNETWVRTYRGHWKTEPDNTEWADAWHEFQESVKYKSRYFFFTNSELNNHPFDFGPAEILDKIATHVRDLSLVRLMTKGTQLFRVREKLTEATWKLEESQLLAPPNKLAAAGRMNPAGISYMYLATEPRVAFSEVLSSPPCVAALAEFDVVKDLRLLNLTSLPDMPSIFDVENQGMRQAIQFLGGFIKDITKPVRKDGREHVSYVPSQVVSEYFNQVFVTSEGKVIDGIMYPSAVQPGGKNVVLFPPREDTGFESLVKYVDGNMKEFQTWEALQKALSSTARFRQSIAKK